MAKRTFTLTINFTAASLRVEFYAIRRNKIKHSNNIYKIQIIYLHVQQHISNVLLLRSEYFCVLCLHNNYIKFLEVVNKLFILFELFVSYF